MTHDAVKHNKHVLQHPDINQGCFLFHPIVPIQPIVPHTAERLVLPSGQDLRGLCFGAVSEQLLPHEEATHLALNVEAVDVA